MQYNVDDVRGLIDDCIVKLVEALDRGQEVDTEVLREAQAILSLATGQLSKIRELEETVRRYESSNILRFPRRS